MRKEKKQLKGEQKSGTFSKASTEVNEKFEQEAVAQDEITVPEENEDPEEADINENAGVNEEFEQEAIAQDEIAVPEENEVPKEADVIDQNEDVGCQTYSIGGCRKAG